MNLLADETEALIPLVERLSAQLLERDLSIATAESCTGGILAALLTAFSGSSKWFERGFVTYSNQAKIDMVGVLPDTLAQFGAVSEEVAVEMARGALDHSLANCTISITGIAGPDGGTKEKPVGLVYFAWAGAWPGLWSGSSAGMGQDIKQESRVFQGDRETIRAKSLVFALEKASNLMLK